MNRYILWRFSIRIEQGSHEVRLILAIRPSCGVYERSTGGLIYLVKFSDGERHAFLSSTAKGVIRKSGNMTSSEIEIEIAVRIDDIFPSTRFEIV